MQATTAEKKPNAVSLRVEQSQNEHARENIAAGLTEPPARTIEYAEKVSAKLEQVKAQRQAKEQNLGASKSSSLTQ